MFIWKGEQEAGAGTYWDMSSGERITIEDQGTLPGDASTKYIKASSAMVLLLGPFVGLAFAIFLPFIGIALAISFVGKKVAIATKKNVEDMVSAGAKNIFFAWRPLHAYLAKKRQRGKSEKGKGKTNVAK